MDGLQMTMQRVKIPGGGNLQFEIRGDDPDNPDFPPPRNTSIPSAMNPGR